jgi:hypothetical protein
VRTLAPVDKPVSRPGAAAPRRPPVTHFPGEITAAPTDGGRALPKPATPRERGIDINEVTR